MTGAEYLRYLKKKHSEFHSEFPKLSRQAVALIVQRHEYNHGRQIPFGQECKAWRDFFEWSIDPYFELFI